MIFYIQWKIKNGFVVMSVKNLQFFIRRHQTLQLYRSMLRSTRKIVDKELSKQLHGEIKREFKSKIHLTDPLVIKNLIIEGRRNLEKLEALSPQKIDSDSWIQIEDQNDIRGRVGQGWPWEK